MATLKIQPTEGMYPRIRKKLQGTPYRRQYLRENERRISQY